MDQILKCAELLNHSHLFVNIWNVYFCVWHLNKPLFTIFSDFSEIVFEGAEGAHMQRLFLRKNICIYNVNHLLIST